MNKNHIWIGTFPTESAFENYLDQSAFYQAWNKYNNEPLEDGEEDAEPGEEVSCKFCREIGTDSYDEDFIYIHYEESRNFEALLSHIPANTKKIVETCNQKDITNANAFVCYSSKELETVQILKTVKNLFI